MDRSESLLETVEERVYETGTRVGPRSGVRGRGCHSVSTRSRDPGVVPRCTFSLTRPSTSGIVLGGGYGPPSATTSVTSGTRRVTSVLDPSPYICGFNVSSVKILFSSERVTVFSLSSGTPVLAKRPLPAAPLPTHPRTCLEGSGPKDPDVGTGRNPTIVYRRLKQNKVVYQVYVGTPGT